VRLISESIHNGSGFWRKGSLQWRRRLGIAGLPDSSSLFVKSYWKPSGEAG
jgi:hypothetical protein